MRARVSSGSAIPNEAAAMKSGEETDQQAGAKKVLVLDNDESMRTVMRLLLGRAGYKSYVTEDRGEAIERYREALKHGHPFDAVILDWNSRGERGITETVKKLLEIDPDAKAIVSSCVLDGPPITNISEYGFRGALTKPFTSDELEQVVHAVVNEPRHMKKVLIVDDNYYFLTGLLMSLYGYLKNCNILTAGNGKKALEIMEYIPVDLIVTDLEMPIMDGYELVESVKKKQPDLPVFIMTGSGAPEAEKRLASLGAPRCFEKPFGFKKLADMIAAELGALSSVAA